MRRRERGGLACQGARPLTGLIQGSFLEASSPHSYTDLRGWSQNPLTPQQALVSAASVEHRQGGVLGRGHDAILYPNAGQRGMAQPRRFQTRLVVVEGANPKHPSLGTLVSQLLPSGNRIWISNQSGNDLALRKSTFHTQGCSYLVGLLATCRMQYLRGPCRWLL